MKLSLINKILIGVLSLLLLFLFWNTLILRYGININQTSVIKQIKALKQLETASFTIEKIVDAGSNGNVLQEFLYGDKVLLIAHGQVVAGFDFESMNQNDIVIQGQKITVTLPSPNILYSRLDNEKTKVYDRTRGLLAPKNSDLEARARQAAETSIREAACESGILIHAKENGEKQLLLLLKTLNFSEVNISIPEGSC